MHREIALLLSLSLCAVGGCTKNSNSGVAAGDVTTAGPPGTTAVEDRVPAGTVTMRSGLQYIDEVVGTGETPREGQTVQVHYTGRLIDGTVFDSSVERGRPFTFTLGKGQVIRGWDDGVAGMKVGGKRKLIVPPHMGYGANGTPDGSIPPHSTLKFDVELLGIQ